MKPMDQQNNWKGSYSQFPRGRDIQHATRATLKERVSLNRGKEGAKETEQESASSIVGNSS